MNRLPIAADATEVAFFPEYGFTPKIKKIARHTKDQVVLEDGMRFNRARGGVIGSYLRVHVTNVTPEVRDQVAASELYDQAEAAWGRAWAALQVKQSAERDALHALGAGKKGSTVAEVLGAMERLDSYTKALE